jgi:hypothetical protein
MAAHINVGISLEISGKHLAVPFVHLLDGSDPVALPVRIIATARTLYHAKSLRLVGWVKMQIKWCGARGSSTTEARLSITESKRFCGIVPQQKLIAVIELPLYVAAIQPVGKFTRIFAKFGFSP